MQNDIIQYLRNEGYEIDDKPYSSINTWLEWFKGKSDSFHKYMHYNGISYKQKERYSLGMPKKISESWADLLLNENVFITTNKQKELDDILKDNNFRKQANKLIEKTFALGTGAFVEYKDIKGNPKIDYIIAPMIFPLRIENGEILDCAFGSVIKGGYYLNIHELQKSGRYKITNKYIKKDNQLKSFVLYTKDKIMNSYYSDEKLFQIITPNITNNINIFSSMGLSIYANAIDEIKNTDLVFDSFRNEFELGKKKIFVKSGAINIRVNETGDTIPIFDENQTEFHAMPDEDSKDMIQESEFNLRVTEHIDGLNTALNLLGDKCGFGNDYFSFKDGKVYTNTNQVISTQSKLYRTLKKHEIVLDEAFVGMVKALMYLKTGKVYKEDITTAFDDSIIEDTGEIKKQAQLEYNMDLIDAIQYYQDVYKMTENQAIEFYNKIQSRKPKKQEPPLEE